MIYKIINDYREEEGDLPRLKASEVESGIMATLSPTDRKIFDIEFKASGPVKSNSDFFMVVNTIQLDENKKLDEIADESGVALKTLYNMQREHFNPGSGHTTTINVINKLLKAYPKYRKVWNKISGSTTVPIEESALVSDLKNYTSIPVLGTFRAKQNDPTITSLKIGARNNIWRHNIMLQTCRIKNPVVVKWDTPWNDCYSIYGQMGKRLQKNVKLYDTCLGNYCLIQLKAPEKYDLNLDGICVGWITQDESNLPNTVTIYFYYERVDKVRPDNKKNRDKELDVANVRNWADQQIIVENVAIEDFDYALPEIQTSPCAIEELFAYDLENRSLNQIADDTTIKK